MTRALTASDIPAALALSSQAGWNQTADDWRILVEAEPEGCFGIECDGRLAATTTLTCYGRRLAWLGMVLTHADYRRRGFASVLLAHVLQLAEIRGIETIKLDATEQGQPLYERFGFIAEREVERWSGAGGEATIPAVSCATAGFAALDLEAFPADRSRILHRLAAHGLAGNDGFVLTRPGRLAAYLGPCIARSPDTAARLIRDCILSRRGPWFWDLLPSNPQAVSIAKGLGFAPERRLMRMRRGSEAAERNELIYAIAGFELG